MLSKVDHFHTSHVWPIYLIIINYDHVASTSMMAMVALSIGTTRIYYIHIKEQKHIKGRKPLLEKHLR